ncbi:MAG: YciI family protein [Asticcacaulis sp.]|nr:YciI family protein [Asticcacaulis sp.]
MKYALLIYENAASFETYRDDPTYQAAFPAFTQTLIDAGIMVAGAGLQGVETATTIRVGDKGHTVEDGPFAETREMLGGFYIIDVPSLDEALKWAARVPIRAGCSIEVRPQMVM